MAERLELITIGGKTFPLPVSPADSARRKVYFEEKLYEKEPNVLGPGTGPEPKPQKGGADKVPLTITLTIGGELQSELSKEKFPGESYTLSIADLLIDSTKKSDQEKVTQIGTYIQDTLKTVTFQVNPLLIKTVKNIRYLAIPIKSQQPGLWGNILRRTFQIILNKDDNEQISFTKEDNLFKYGESSFENPGFGTDDQNKEYDTQDNRYILLKELEESDTIDTFKGLQIPTESFELQGKLDVEWGENKYSQQFGTSNIPGEPTTEETEEEKKEDKDTSDIVLKEEEKTILRELGFDYELLRELGSHLPEFFDTLPNCSTDTALLLKKECQTAYFVLWSIMFKVNARLEERMKDQPPSKRVLTDIDAGLARQTAQALYDLHKPKIQFDPILIRKLFTRLKLAKLTEEELEALKALLTTGFGSEL